MNTAEASNSFSPFTLLKRLLEIIQISRGMLAMRISVMELGRFTLLGGSRGLAGRLVDYPPREWGTQCDGWGGIKTTNFHHGDTETRRRKKQFLFFSVTPCLRGENC